MTDRRTSEGLGFDLAAGRWLGDRRSDALPSLLRPTGVLLLWLAVALVVVVLIAVGVLIGHAT
jgi:hypothetical protein